MKQFLNMLLGNYEPAIFGAYFLLALIGVLVSLLLNGLHRDPLSTSSPLHFSWQFFLSDNVRRVVLGLLLIYLALRFTTQLFGITLNEWWAIAIGLSNDKIAQAVKNLTKNFGQKQ